MWKSITFLMAAAFVLGFESRPAQAQPAPDAGASTVVTRMMAFDKNSDGQITKDEVTDERLLPLFERADVSKDGIVTKEELARVSAAINAEVGAGGDARGRGGRGRGGPGGPGGPGDAGGPGGPGGRGGRGPGGPAEPGQVLPQFMRDSLNLSAEQGAQLDALQKDVDEKLGKILTEMQKAQLQEFRGRGRGGRGGPPMGGRGQ